MKRFIFLIVLCLHFSACDLMNKGKRSLKSALIGSRVTGKLEDPTPAPLLDAEIQEGSEEEQVKKVDPKESLYSYMRIFSTGPSSEMRKILQIKMEKVKFHLRSEDLVFIRLIRSWEHAVLSGNLEVISVLIFFHQHTMAVNREVVASLLKIASKEHFDRFVPKYVAISNKLDHEIVLSGIAGWEENVLLGRRKIFSDLSESNNIITVFKQKCIDEIDLEILKKREAKKNFIPPDPTPIPTAIYVDFEE